jgi:hypothetical protein
VGEKLIVARIILVFETYYLHLYIVCIIFLLYWDINIGSALFSEVSCVETGSLSAQGVLPNLLPVKGEFLITYLIPAEWCVNNAVHTATFCS